MIMNKIVVFCIFLIAVLCGQINAENPAKDLLKVSNNKHFLVHADGRPFFYLGDTAWELFHRTTKQDAELYLKTRSTQGYTVIQAVAVSELQGDQVPNVYGFLPWKDSNPDQIMIKDGPDNDYWDYVDFIVRRANDFGLYVGFLPSWGEYWKDRILNEKNARRYGKFLGERYKNAGLIWILGGDRPANESRDVSILRELAAGIRDGGARQLITFHPCGACGSAQWLHEEKWLDFNMRQNGHTDNYSGRYDKTLEDYERTPTKPILDAEPIYEDHPIDFNAKERGYSTAIDVRRAFYWDVFNGACGHIYGNHAVWQMYDGKREPVNMPLMTWREAIVQPGARQMIFGRKLMESRPFLTRIPDPNLIVTDRVATNIPGEGRYRFVATRDEAGTYAMIYVPVGRKFYVQTSVLKAKKIKGWWYNPRTGVAKSIGIFDNKDKKLFKSPTPGEDLDWVLVLDDLAKDYPAPGRKRLNDE
jgi:hypothetical protein